MDIQKRKKRVVLSSAVIISVGVHVALVFMAGSIVAMKFYKKKDVGFQVEKENPKLERRNLQIPVKTAPFIEQMSKPTLQTTSRITANTPQVNISEQGEYVKMAPIPTFKGGYTNFIQMDRTMEFNSKYRDVSFGLSSVDFFGTRGKAEKVVVLVDTSESMLFDDRGGPDSYEMVREKLNKVIEEMRSATLFNVVLFDVEKVALFNQTMLPATPSAKTNVLEWIGGVNTNMTEVGLTDAASNYIPKKQYDIPMADSDVTGWIKAFRAAAELQPDIIFVLSSDWGNVTTISEGISYFKKSRAFAEYQKKRAELFILNDRKEIMEEYLSELDELRSAAAEMLELENQARIESGMQPKVVRDWDEILYNNKINLPFLPIAKEGKRLDVSPLDTRYTMEEVLETLFVIIMDNYREKGFPLLNFVMLTAEDYSKGSTEAASSMTSDAKFKELAKMVKGRFRYLRGNPKVNNLLDQDLDEVLERLTPSEL